MSKLSFKQELRNRIDEGSIDVPPRVESGQYGTKNPSALSTVIARIKRASTPQELAVAARRARTDAEQNAAIRKDSFFKLNDMPANREVCITFDWDQVMQPEDAHIARYCVAELLDRMLRGSYRAAKLQLMTANFVAVPEIWTKDGKPIPLHFHLLIDVPVAGLPWFDANIGRVWEGIIRPIAIMGSVHNEPIENKNKLSRYSLKQIDLEWVFDRTIWPIDLPI